MLNSNAKRRKVQKGVQAHLSRLWTDTPMPVRAHLSRLWTDTPAREGQGEKGGQNQNKGRRGVRVHVTSMDRHTRAKGEWEEDDRVAQLSKESEGQREDWVWLYNESK